MTRHVVAAALTLAFLLGYLLRCDPTDLVLLRPCPGGAAQQTTSLFSTAMGFATAGKRVLLRRGGTYTSSALFQHVGTGPGIVGAYGTGAKPRITSTQNDTVLRPAGGLNDWRYMDLEFFGPGPSQTFATAISAFKMVDNLYLRLTISNYPLAISIDPLALTGYPADLSVLTEGWVLADSNLGPGSGNNGFWIGANLYALIGNDVNWNTAHSIRLPVARRVALADNDVHQATGSACCVLLKLHAPPFAAAGDYSQFVSISRNFWRMGSAHPWGITIAPQNQDGDERVRWVDIASNRFVGNTNSQILMLFQGVKETATRNNIFDMAAMLGELGGKQEFHPFAGSSTGNRWIGNTCFGDGGSFGDSTCLNLGSAAGLVAKNNLMYATGGGTEAVVTGTGDLANNLNVSTNPFSVFPPVNAPDFRLLPGSVPAGAGVALPANILDFGAALRPSPPSVGAWEVAP